MTPLHNLELLSVGVAIAGIGVLGFAVFFSNQKSITNRSFLFLAITAALWSIYNYLYNAFPNPESILVVFRIHIFFAIWYTFSLFQFFFVFPKQEIRFPQLYKFVLSPITVFVSFLSLTPLMFSKILSFNSLGRPSTIETMWGIIPFSLLLLFLVFGGIIIFIKKLLKSQGNQRSQFKVILMGLAITFGLHLIFNFLFPTFLNNPRYVQFGAIFTLPFVVLTAVAIKRYQLFNLKVVATEFLTFILSVITLYEIIFADDLLTRILRIGTFLLVLGFGILLIKNVRKEVEQREKLEILTKELEEKNEKLAAADKIKSEFLGFAAHQVKSPMAVVKGYASLIVDGTLGQVSDEIKNKAQKIKETADRLIALVNNLLDMRKMEEGKLEIKFGSMDVGRLVHDMAEEYKIVGSGKGLDVQFETNKESIMMEGDEQKLRQVFQNIIDNSIKYTDKGFVKISIQDAGEKVIVTVNDSGKGMSQGLQQKMFQQFVRDEQTKNEVQGTGLGLYLAKRIVLAHHGEIKGFSAGPNMGSTFTVRLSKK